MGVLRVIEIEKEGLGVEKVCERGKERKKEGLGIDFGVMEMNIMIGMLVMGVEIVCGKIIMMGVIFCMI